MKSMISRNLVAIAGAALLAAGSAQGDIVLTDDFNDGVIDTAKWNARTGGASTITESGGVVFGAQNSDRPYLTSVNGWDPADGALTMTGRFNITSGSAVAFWTRALGDYDSTGVLAGGASGVNGSGVRVAWWTGSTGNGLSVFEKDDAQWPWDNKTTSAVVDGANLTKATGTYDFVITDDGSTVTMVITNTANAADTGSISLATTFAPTVTNNSVVIAMNNGVEFDYVTVDVVPEPTSLALLGLGGMLLARRRRAQ